jgi:hypothetical protein
MAFKVETKRISPDKTQITFKPDLEKTRRIAKQKGFTDIQAEILAELTALNPLWIHAYDIKAILNIAEGYGVRLHHRSRGRIINIDIIYKPVPDAYEVKAYKITNNGLDEKLIANYQDVYFPELEERIKDILNQ